MAAPSPRWTSFVIHSGIICKSPMARIRNSLRFRTINTDYVCSHISSYNPKLNNNKKVKNFC